MNNVNKTQRKNAPIPLKKYKDYFKSFVKFKKIPIYIKHI